VSLGGKGLRRRTPLYLQQYAKDLTWPTFNKKHVEQQSFFACSVLLMAQKVNPDTESS
jgi:REP element-mobilizing transposase RayT